MKLPAALLCLVACGLMLGSGVHAKFHWGVASAGFQHDGYFPDSNWMRYSAAGTNIVNPIGNSVDFYHRYKADIALAQAMGVNTFRTSMEWARIEPEQGVINQTELARYDDLVSTVIAAGMTPMITLDHWVYPGWVKDQGGWTWSGIVAAWLSNANRVVSRYAGRGIMWITINEPTEYIVNEGKFGGLNSTQQTQMATYLVSIHRQAYDLIHLLDVGAMVSSNLAYEPPPLQSSTDAQFFNLVTDKLDFIAVDYYYGLSLSNPSVAILEVSNNYWDVQPLPDGIYAALTSYHAAVPGLPLYIVENGFPTNDGSPVHLYSSTYNRTNHLQDHIYWVQRAVNDGVNVIGYNCWSLTDNYEWGSYQPRFGLYTVNVLTDATLTRTATDGVATYKAIIANSGVPSGYVPVMAPTMCSAEYTLLYGNSICPGSITPLTGVTTSSPTTAAPTAAMTMSPVSSSPTSAASITAMPVSSISSAPTIATLITAKPVVSSSPASATLTTTKPVVSSSPTSAAPITAKPVAAVSNSPPSVPPTTNASSTSGSIIGGIIGSVLGFFGLAGAIVLRRRMIRRRAPEVISNEQQTNIVAALPPSEGVVNPKFGSVEV